VRELDLGIAPLVVLAFYLAMMVGIGWLGRVSRKNESLSDFYLAGSSFGVTVLFLTLFATQYSGNTLLGFAGTAFRQGGTYVVSVLFMVLAMTVISIYGPRLFKLSRRFGYVTPSDYLQHRFGSHSLRIICSLLLTWGLANYILEQLVAMGHALEAFSGGRISFMAGVVLLVVVMLVYESLGGMRSVAWTDCVQGGLLFAGCMVILYLLLTSEGGLAQAGAYIAQNQPEKFEVPGPDGLRVWLSQILLLAFGVAVYPHAIQRLFAARSLGSLRTSLAGMAFMPFATTLLAFLLGIIAISRYHDLTGFDSDKITLYMLADIAEAHPLAKWLVILVFVALVAAIMSTADSALLSTQSMLIKDIYKPYLNPDASAQHYLRVGKISGWVLMVALVGSAWISHRTESSIWQLIKLKLEFMVQIAPAFVAGVYWRRLSAGPLLAGILVGTGITLVLWVGTVAGVFGTDMRSPWNISAGVWGLLANWIVCVGGTLIFSARAAASESAKPIHARD
jgi:SSS family solute:Na+ symporter/sodium/pantothenate symporter